jgi:predicted secreted protein
VPLLSRSAILAAVALAGLVSGCGIAGGSAAANDVTVAVDAGAAWVVPGQTLRVDLGEANPSIGDSWHLVSAPDPAVVADRGDDFASDCDQPGCGGRLVWTFVAAGPGSTTVVFRYCYRSQPDNCQAEPGRGPAAPVPLTITVG